MKKALFFLCLAFLFLSTKIIYAHGFGVHAAHLSSVLALNDQYKTLIEDPRYQPYFIYGSIFPDIQYAPSFKSTLQNLYQQIRGVTLREATNGWIPDNAAAFEGLTYEINTDQIPDNYPFGIDTHSDKYALAFAEYLLQQCAPVNPPGPNPGSNGTTNAHDARNMKLAFALGYYAHLAEDVACHDFLVPKITASLDLGDLELIKNPQSFAEDPNAQLEGIIEGIMDYYYGSNSTIADMIYNEIWVGRSQFEPTITQMDFTKGYAHLLFNGPTPTYYDAIGGWPEMNPVLLFFHEALNTWYNTNPFNLPTIGEESYKKDNAPLSATGFYQLATVFRFVNRFYPAIVGQPFNGFNRLDEVLADWVSNHLDLSDATNAWGITLSWFIASFPGIILAQEINVSMLSGFAYPDIRDGFTTELSRDSRSLIGLMLSDISKADELATNYPDRINIESYNKLKTSVLFTNPTELLSSIWNEYKNLGTKIYQEVGPGGKWYSDWSPFHKQSMAWGVLSSLNNSIPDIYTSNQNVAVYDAYFQVNDTRITGPQNSQVFQNNPNVKTKIELYNTSNVPSESITLSVKRDHNSTDYSLDPLKTSTTFSIDHDPLLYNTTDRKKIELIVPSVSLTELTNYRGYYMEAVKNSNNKAMFTSSFEQYQERLDLTPNYSRLYGSYDQGKWPVSLGLLKDVATVNLNAAQFPEGGGAGGYYKINGITQNNITGYIDDYINLEAFPPSGWIFLNWSDGNLDNPRTYKITNTNTSMNALFKGTQISNNQNSYAENSQRKFVRTPSNGYYHHVYESMNKVWYEMSTDNGNTWTVMNAGKPLSITDSKNPCITIIGDFSVAITFQEEINSYYDIRVLNYNYILDEIWDSENAAYGYCSLYEDDADPVISFSSKQFSRIIVVWKVKDEGPYQPGGLYYRYGYLTGGASSSENIVWSITPLIVSGTDANSSQPCIDSKNNDHPLKFHLAWKQSSEIKYYCFDVDGSTFNIHSNQTLSTGSGFQDNLKPSILAIYNGTARVSWIGYRSEEEEEEGAFEKTTNKIAADPSDEYRTVFKSTDYYHFWNFGYDVNSVNINGSDPDYTIAWGRANNLPVQFADSYTLSTIYTLSGLTGKDIQMCNGGAERTTMRAMAFNSSSQPNYFNSGQLYSTNKVNLADMGSGREGVVYKDNAQFFFAIGDIRVDGKPVEFIEMDDTVSFYSNKRLNEFLLSESFSLSDNSDFTYSIQYGITDSAAALNVLGKNDFIKFSVELIDDKHGKSLGIFDDIKYTKTNVNQYQNITYQVSTKGIGNKTVRLRLVTESNFDSKFSLTDRYAEGNALLKSSFKQVSFEGSLEVKDYALEQNYPNPFNPTTTINYQIKEDGLVTLKIYDILGAELKTLVNEEKIKGRYTHSFDGSDLASGVYIYQLKVNDYVSSKKLMLLK